MEQGYITGVIYASIIACIAMAATPKGVYRTLVGLSSGLILILVLCRPVSGLLRDGFDGISGFELNQPQLEKYTNEQDKLLKELIAEKTSAYIFSKAQAMGVSCQASVTVSDDTPHVPELVLISGPDAPPPEEQRRLSELIEDECGIPQNRQLYKWG